MNRRSFVNFLIASAAITGNHFEKLATSAPLDKDNSLPAGSDEAAITLRSPFLDVVIEPRTGNWICRSTSQGLLFDRATASLASSAAFLKISDPQVRKTVSSLTFSDPLGTGTQGLLSAASEASGLRFGVAIKVYNQFAGLSLECHVENRRQSQVHLERVVPLWAHVIHALAADADRVQMLVNGFNSWDYAHLQSIQSAAEIKSFDRFATKFPQMVAGFLSATKAYGTFEYSIPSSHIPVIKANAEYKVLLPPGEARRTDALLILFPDDLLEGLENYATAVQKWNNLHPKQSASTTWCSWYAGYGRAKQANLDALEKAMVENAKLMAPLVPLGVDTLRVVDDSNDEHYGDWNFPFVPHGMGALAAKLRGMGRKPGVWLAPAFISETSKVFKKHPEWLQRYSNGKLVIRRNFYGNTMHFFDASHPGALSYLRDLFLHIRNWGFAYVMVDFMYTFGLSNHYHNPLMTRAEIYQSALRTIREALGPEIYLLGCGAPQLASVGLVDGMRIGPDAWGKVGYENVASRYFEAGKWWLNDPDALVGNRRTVEGYRAWVTLAAMSGSVLTIGDDLAMLARDKLDILKKILPAQGRVGRPLDLFDSNPSNVWFLRTSTSEKNSAVLSLFNWNGNENLVHHIKPMDILRTTQPVLVYDFWNDYFFAESSGLIEVSVALGHVRTLCLAERTGAPQVLAISNFLPQNSWALGGITWSESINVLEGQARGETGAYFHIALYVPEGYQPEEAQSNGQPAFLVKQQKNVWVIPMKGTGRASKWSVRFRA